LEKSITDLSKSHVLQMPGAKLGEWMSQMFLQKITDTKCVMYSLNIGGSDVAIVKATEALLLRSV